MKQIIIKQSITNREGTSFDKYCTEVSKEDMITVEEETELAKRIHKGDLLALDKLVRANLRFVISVANKYQNRGLTLSDLINEGNLGLIKAAQRFDETRGFKFISFAFWWIRQAIIQSVTENCRVVRLPPNKISEIGKINQAFSKLEQEYQREPNIEEMAELLNLPENIISDVIRVSPFQVSIDAPLVKDDTSCLADILVNVDIPKTDNLLMLESLNEDINRMLNTLSDRERVVVQLFYGIGMKYGLSLDQIAEKQGLTVERIRQIKEKAIEKLKQGSMSKLLQTYLG